LSLKKTKLVVLNIKKYSDNSLIVQAFSQNSGLLSLIYTKSKGAKSQTYFQALNVLEVSYYLKPKSSLYRVKEVAFIPSLSYQGAGIATNAIRFFIAEFLYYTIQEKEANTPLYSFIERNIGLLNESNYTPKTFSIEFIYNLCPFVGIAPDLTTEGAYFDLQEGLMVEKVPLHQDHLDLKDSVLIKQLNSDLSTLNKKERNRLLDILILYYNIQFGGTLERLSSKKILMEVFE